MKLKEFAENINRLLKERPEVSEFEVITSKDDEGNGYNLAYYKPGVGYYDDRDFEPEEEMGFTEDGVQVNAVCVN